MQTPSTAKMFTSTFRVVLLLLALSASINVGNSISWRRLDTSDQFKRRWFASLAYYNNQLFLFGGEGAATNATIGGVLGDAWRLPMPVSPGSSPLQWESIQLSGGPSPRFGAISGVIGNYWIITHGCDRITCFADTWALDLDTTRSQWIVLVNASQAVLPMPEARFTAAGGIYPGTQQLWLSMGEDVAGKKLSDTWVLEVDVEGSQPSAMWRVVSSGGGFNQYHPYLPHARFLHSGTPVSNSTFVIFGGCASGGQAGGQCPLQDSWSLDQGNGEWTQLPVCAPPTVRQNMIAVPNQPGAAYLMNGNYLYTPGVFTQQIMSPVINDSVLYVLETTNGVAAWKAVGLSGKIPSRREGASVAIGNGVVYLLGGRTINSSLFDLELWELSKTGGADYNESCLAEKLTYVHLHGIFMYVAWGLFLPLGLLVGRYYRWTWPVWFIVHVICQSLGVLLTVAGFVLIFLVGSYSSPNFPHAIVGIVLTFLMVQQFLSGIYHPCVDKENGKSSEKSKFRKCWEVYHAASGFLSVVIGFGQVTLGVLLIGAPMQVWLAWSVLGGTWILVIVIHELGYLCWKLISNTKKS